MNIIKHPTLYKRDTAGKIRVWYLERQGDSYRTVAGIKDGKLVESDWTVCVGKQGRSDAEQAEFEVASGYEHQLTREYHASEDTVDQPKFFKPMLAHKYEGWTDTAWAQPKLDGIRCLASAAGLFSREGKPILGAPHVMEALAPIFEANPGVQFDGELYNHDLKDDFNKIVSLVKKQNPTPEQLAESAAIVQYHIYDLPSSPEGFAKRVVALREMLGAGTDVLKRVPTWWADTKEVLDSLYGEWLEAGYEGQMVRGEGPYPMASSVGCSMRGLSPRAWRSCSSPSTAIPPTFSP